MMSELNLKFGLRYKIDAKSRCKLVMKCEKLTIFYGAGSDKCKSCFGAGGSNDEGA